MSDNNQPQRGRGIGYFDFIIAVETIELTVLESLVLRAIAFAINRIKSDKETIVGIASAGLSSAVLAEKCNLSERQILRLIKSLREKSLIETFQNKKGREAEEFRSQEWQG